MSSAATDNRTISADTPATVVPSGESIVIPAGSAVVITHRLGGNFTVTWEYGMARIAGQYAANIGEALPEWATPTAKKEEEDSSTPPAESELWEALKTVFDPEIPVNIVDLGLVYSLDIEPLSPPEAPTSQSGYKVWMKMTLTAPGCGMGPAIAADAKARLEQVRAIRQAQVDIVWEPAWNQDMISQEGKMQLGLI
jgi:probable FeS assembly SUF system protein SufT